MGETGTGTVNSSSKLSSSNSSSSGSFHTATTGESKGGVSVISNSSSIFSARSGRLDHSHLPASVMRVKTSETGVAVITNKPNMKTM